MKLTRLALSRTFLLLAMWVLPKGEPFIMALMDELNDSLKGRSAYERRALRNGGTE